jgi:hypothetical protein
MLSYEKKDVKSIVCRLNYIIKYRCLNSLETKMIPNRLNLKTTFSVYALRFFSFKQYNCRGFAIAEKNM